MGETGMARQAQQLDTWAVCACTMQEVLSLANFERRRAMTTAEVIAMGERVMQLQRDEVIVWVGSEEQAKRVRAIDPGVLVCVHPWLGHGDFIAYRPKAQQGDITWMPREGSLADAQRG